MPSHPKSGHCSTKQVNFHLLYCWFDFNPENSSTEFLCIGKTFSYVIRSNNRSSTIVNSHIRAFWTHFLKSVVDAILALSSGFRKYDAVLVLQVIGLGFLKQIPP
eukprot:TRINITY_DN8740_c0_g1_i1.p1 TRINITY_DN8740_c0_g1~~TRINITY_DN8740_c0_g1_i1.p1  ORF type:complete len:105 (+),score=5.55 TRINITY_DN8740_c0_g1_i1:67-381(+)